MLLNFEHVTKSYGDRTLLEDVSFYMAAGDRIGVVGVNGCGKSTLLRLASMREVPDEGRVSTDPNVRIGYLTQSPEFDPEMTVIRQVTANLDPDAREVALYESIEILTRLGITETDKKMGELSGGQRKRVSLASVLVHPCDLLILDEPTNHLDSEMIEWLEDYLQGFSGGILLITHDRYFLERVSSRTAEVAFGKLYFYEGGYSAYLEGRARREEMQAASERKRKSILRRELIWVLQGPCARGTKSRERLERYEALKAKLPPEYHTDMEEIKAISSRLGKKTIELVGASKRFDGRYVIKNCSFLLQRDDRIGIIGNNGTGKSTLLNLISGRLSPDEGSVITGETVKIGYFSQHADELNGKMTAIEYVKQFGDSIDTGDGVLTAAKLMERFLFPVVIQHRPIEKLSGGEKRRLFLLGVLAAAPNVLLLDEPTNDLDIPTLLVLEEYLETFPGAIIAVSHDRYFTDRICKRIFAVSPDGSLEEFPGGYTEWKEHREALVLEAKKAEKAASVPAPVREKPKSTKLKFSFKEQREYETIDSDIAALEEKIEANAREQEKSGSDYVKLGELMAEASALEAALEEKMERWVYLNDLAEKIAAQK